ncbi:TonB-dependent receptor plug domain-containing protein [Trichlorobacter lovleyi]|uniref:TonB-dependent receptor plug domain-containing protein n=1 Tax=Trichlorobacter lovleyi TaxID=313985 RepID=UPI003D0C07EC
MKIILRHSLKILLPLWLLAAPLTAAAEPDDSIGLLDAWQGETVSASRLPKPVSHTAENVTVVTAAEIQAINAHTLIDILATIPGMQLESLRTLGSATYLRIQGSSFRHILVMVDGVPFNNLGDNFSDIGLIPARIIERVEIVKGAASSSWGQALGGVINVITKAPDRERKSGGSLSSSVGERRTSDSGAELSGSIERFGYYLSGGYSGSKGLLANNHGDYSNAYAKLVYDLPGKGQLSGTFGYNQGNRGDFAFAPLDLKEETYPRQLFSTLTLRTALTDQLELELNGRHATRENGINVGLISTYLPLQSYNIDETSSGVGAKLLWRTSSNLLAVGAEYDHVWMRSTDSLVHVDTLNRKTDRWGFYLNDTLTVGNFSFSPGVRLDLTGTSGDQFSPSFGITWQLTDTTLLRAYTARGYSLPAFLLDRTSEKVWTSQIGFESTTIPYLWLKGTLFRNETWDIVTYDSFSNSFNHERHIKQGFEVEAKTVALFNTSLSAGYDYIDARNTSTHQIVQDIPRHTLLLGLQYDDRQYLKGVLNGRHIWWNAASYHNGSYQGVIWDLHLTATPFGRKQHAPELFFSIRNIFNGSQYLDEFFNNTGRWVEGGVRISF